MLNLHDNWPAYAGAAIILIFLIRYFLNYHGPSEEQLGATLMTATTSAGCAEVYAEAKRHGHDAVARKSLAKFVELARAELALAKTFDANFAILSHIPDDPDAAVQVLWQEAREKCFLLVGDTDEALAFFAALPDENSPMSDPDFDALVIRGALELARTPADADKILEKLQEQSFPGPITPLEREALKRIRELRAVAA